jgi:hypothetical protein
MPSKLRSGSRVATCAAALLLVIVGCGGGAAVDSSPSSPAIAVRSTPTPTRKPSFSPVPSQSPSPPIPTLAPPVSAIETLKIGSPYVFVFNPANTALSANFSFQMGSINVTETMSGREIHQRGKIVGLAYVIEFTGIPMSDAAFEGGARGAAANTGGKLTYGKVLGHRVAYVVTRSASFALYRHVDAIVMVGAQTLSLTKTLLTSVIKAND